LEFRRVLFRSESQIVDFSFVQIQSQIMKADRHFYGTEEVLHGFYSRKGCAFKIRIAWNVEYISGKLCKTLWILLIYIACPASPYRGKSGSVRHIIKTAKFVLELMTG